MFQINLVGMLYQESFRFIFVLEDFSENNKKYPIQKSFNYISFI